MLLVDSRTTASPSRFEQQVQAGGRLGRQQAPLEKRAGGAQAMATFCCMPQRDILFHRLEDGALLQTQAGGVSTTWRRVSPSCRTATPRRETPIGLSFLKKLASARRD